MPLVRLTYASHPFGFDDAMLAGILLDARRCNARDGVSGALIVRRDLFLQWLEGPRAAVEATFARIRGDDRHANLRAVRRRPVPARLFAGWAMRDDPARPWLWPPEAVAQGAVEAASEAEVEAIFQRVRLSMPV